MSAIVIEQNSPEWHELRANKIGASDAPIIMEVSPWMTPFQLWERKLGITPPQDTTEAMQRGIDMEEEARKAFENETGLIVFPQVRISNEHDWAMASLDGITMDGNTIVEIKCSGQKDHDMALGGQIPEKYFPQLQHQMFVTELDFGYYFSYTRAGAAILKINRDDKYIEKMISKEKEFFDCMLEFVPPKLSEKDFIVKDDEEWQELSGSYLRVKKMLDEMEKEEKKLKEKLISLAGRSNAKGAGIKLSKIVRKGSIDYSAIPELKLINTEQYRKAPVESWRVMTC